MMFLILAKTVWSCLPHVPPVDCPWLLSRLSTVRRGGDESSGRSPVSLWLCLSRNNRNCRPRAPAQQQTRPRVIENQLAHAHWSGEPPCVPLGCSQPGPVSVLRNTAIAPWSCCLHRHPIRLSWIFLSRQVKHRLTARYFAASPFTQDWQVVVHLRRSSSNNFYRLILPLKWPLRFQLLNLKSHNKQILIIRRVTAKVTTHERKFFKTNWE